MSTTAPLDTITISQCWLSAFAAALSSQDADAAANLFFPDGWLRDILAFTWDYRSLSGRPKVRDYLSKHLLTVEVTNVKLCDDIYLRPTEFDAGGGATGVEFGYIFETGIALGKGFVRLAKPMDQDAIESWKALTASTIVVDLKGHEEAQGRANFESATGNASWGEYEARRKAQIEKDPHVLISESILIFSNLVASFAECFHGT